MLATAKSRTDLEAELIELKAVSSRVGNCDDKAEY